MLSTVPVLGGAGQAPVANARAKTRPGEPKRKNTLAEADSAPEKKRKRRAEKRENEKVGHDPLALYRTSVKTEASSSQAVRTSRAWCVGKK